MPGWVRVGVSKGFLYVSSFMALGNPVGGRQITVLFEM
jgi:hypothetical protein